MKYKIRRVEIKDAKAIYSFICLLEETIFDYGKFQSIFEVNIIKEGYYYLVAITETNTVIGFISCHSQNLLHHCAKVAEIQELYVAENSRKAGVGKLLVNCLEEILQAIPCALLEVTAQNKRIPTHIFYEQLGFRHTHKKFIKELH